MHRKSGDTWSNRQVWPWSTEWSREKANRVLPRAHTGHSKHAQPTTQEITWTSPDGQYQNQFDNILCRQRWRSSIQSAKTRPGADCGSDHELLIDKFRLKLKKVGETTRPFRYDLNKIPYDYIVEVTKDSRIRSDRVPNELRTEICDITMSWTLQCLCTLQCTRSCTLQCTGGKDQDHPQEKEMQKGKLIAWGGLTNSWEKKTRYRQKRKGKIYPFECRVPKNSKGR